MGEISIFDWQKRNAPATTGANKKSKSSNNTSIVSAPKTKCKCGTWQDKVKKYLEDDETLRGSDRKLYYVICTDMAKNKNLTLEQVMLGTEFPDYETIRRSRQKIQEQHPSLKPCRKIQEARKELEDEFMAYALNV